MSYVVNVDVGTGSGRAIAFDEAGNQVAASQREWMPGTNPGFPGAQDFDTTNAWRLLAECLRDVVGQLGDRSSRITAVTSTAMREGMVLYDKDGKEIWACPNADARSTDEAAEMISRGLADRIYEMGGDWLSIISPPRFWWIRRHMPEIYRRIAHMNMLSDWVIYRLSGEFMTDPSIGSSSGVFDLRKRDWARALIREIDLPEGIYPPVVESGTRVGRVTAKAAALTGLAAGTPVVAGGADTQLALIGAGVVSTGAFAVCGGTFWQTAIVADSPLIDSRRRLRTLCHAVPGQWMTEGIGFYHGFTMRWFRDGFCDKEREEAESRHVDAYAVMEERASAIPPGSNGVQGIFSNIMEAKRWRHAPPSLVGFNLLDAAGTGKAACIRAIEENAAFVTKGHLDILKELSGKSPREIVFVGGASKGRLWPQIVSDVVGCQLRIPVAKESTSLGGAIAAFTATGAFNSWAEAAAAMVRTDRCVDPQPASVRAYAELYERWLKVNERLVSLSDDRILPALWRAPGV
ncbi:MAG: autoinducer-2 kinase [Spirochaetia bacterium]